LPRTGTVVWGGVGRSELISFGGAVSFFGFFAILLLRWSPLAMVGFLDLEFVKGKGGDRIAFRNTLSKRSGPLVQ
jgi:hypothetical protein